MLIKCLLCSREQMSSDDENDQYYIKATGERMTKEELNRSFLNMAINEKKNSMIDALRKLKAVVNKYRDDLSKFQFSDKSEYGTLQLYKKFVYLFI